MNVQELLENYNSIKVKINILNLEIIKIDAEIAELQSSQLTGLPKATGITESVTERTALKKLEKIEDKKQKIKELEYEASLVEKLVKTLKKTNQDIIEMRFFKRMSIEQISTEKDRTYNTISKIIQKSINDMQKEYDSSIDK